MSSDKACKALGGGVGVERRPPEDQGSDLGPNTTLGVALTEVLTATVAPCVRDDLLHN